MKGQTIYYNCPECGKENGIKMWLSAVSLAGFKSTIWKCKCGFQDDFEQMKQRSENKSITSL